jgi:hypothetical protein
VTKVGCKKKKGSKTPHLIPSHLALSHARRVSAVAAVPYRPPHYRVANTANSRSTPNNVMQTLDYVVGSYIANKLNIAALTAVKLEDS